ncbi:MAG: hypothetical protein QF793_02385 [Candidatus Peribacteraceae bacterium]|jgi:hypothetical protein|nr:hypothetical protein [Candidatus Peribacteraceae bacterium]|tara:strand:- start:8820 stop:9224 length:405 start_codon:yes stop_codon:yes gene_type:complete
MTSKRNRDPARLNNLDFELVDALLESNGEEDAIKAAVLDHQRSAVALACEHILASGLSATSQKNIKRAELVIAVARETSYDSIIDLLYRYVIDDNPDAYDETVRFPVVRLGMERNKRIQERQKNKKAKKAKRKK